MIVASNSYNFVFAQGLSNLRKSFTTLHIRKEYERRDRLFVSSFSYRKRLGKKSHQKTKHFKILAMNDNLMNRMEPEDLTGDGGVVKSIIIPGSGNQAKNGDLVKVDYQGYLSNGDIFDSSLSRGEPFTFRIGEGKVIKGWDIGLKSMKIGEKSNFKVSSFYGYKKKGIPPIIPPNEDLVFEISLLEIIKSTEGEKSLYEGSVLEEKNFDKLIANSGAEVSNSNSKENEGFFSKFFFISPFQSQTGEKAPWLLNPNITFSLVFLVIFLAFYFILKLGVIHIGYVDE